MQRDFLHDTMTMFRQNFSCSFRHLIVLVLSLHGVQVQEVHLYKRIDAKQSFWPKFAYSKVSSVKSNIECGGVCSSELTTLGCKGFVYRENGRECILLSLGMENPGFTVISAPAEENAIHFNTAGKKTTSVTLH